MRIAIFSDVHGNLAALEAVLNHIGQQSHLDQVIFAGDLCLFGPRPQQCFDLLRRHHISSVVGNTDIWIRRPPVLTADLSNAVRLQRERVRAHCAWTAGQLDHSALTWLDQLNDTFQLVISPTPEPQDRLLIVHANPVDVSQIIFPDEERQLELYGRVRQSDEELAPLLVGIDAAVLAFGHLHIPNIRRWPSLTLVNVSSVSLPGDGDARAKYAILSWEADTGWSTQFYRVSYSADAEIEAFVQARPPGWETSVEQLETSGLVSQNV